MTIETRRRNLVTLAGLIAFVMMANGVVALFGLARANETHLSHVATFGVMLRRLEAARTAQVHFKKQVQEWKNLLLRGRNPEDYERYLRAFESEERTFGEQLAALTELSKGMPADLPPLAALKAAHQELGTRYRAALKTFDRSDVASVFATDGLVRGIDRAPTDAVDAIVEVIRARAAALSDTIRKETAEQYAAWRSITIGGTAAGVLLVFVMLWLAFKGAG